MLTSESLGCKGRGLLCSALNETLFGDLRPGLCDVADARCMGPPSRASTTIASEAALAAVRLHQPADRLRPWLQGIAGLSG